MAETDDLRFQMMGLGAPAGAATAAAPKKDGAGASGYATFEGALRENGKFDALVEGAAKSKARLEELADKGATAQVKSDARKALRAYDHAIDLLKKGKEVTVQVMKEQQAKAKAKAKAPGKK